MPDTVDSTDSSLAPVEESREPRFLLPITGAIGLLAASILTIDKLDLLQAKVDGTDAALNCDISAFVSCSGVMDSDQASVFGFANSILGIIGFSVVLTLGLLVAARVALPTFVWAGLQAGAVLGIVFVTWLQYQSIFEINLLCPWCMVVWTMMIPLFVGLTARNLRAWAPGSALTRFLSDWTTLVVALWYLAVVAVIWFQFGPERLFG
jgi:uncharacterized membrane protein